MFKRKVIAIVAVVALLLALALPTFAATEEIASNDFSQTNEVGKYTAMIPGANYAVFDHWKDIEDFTETVCIVEGDAKVSVEGVSADDADDERLVSSSVLDGSLHAAGFIINISFEKVGTTIIRIPVSAFFGSYTYVSNQFFYFGLRMSSESIMSVSPIITVENYDGSDVLSAANSVTSASFKGMAWTRSEHGNDYLTISRAASAVGDYVYKFGMCSLYSFPSLFGSIVDSNYEKVLGSCYAPSYDTYSFLEQNTCFLPYVLSLLPSVLPSPFLSFIPQ